MNFEFVINNRILLQAILTSLTEIPGWEPIKETLWNKYTRGYKLLQGNIDIVLANDTPRESLIDAYNQLDQLLDEGTKQEEFNKCLQATQKYRLNVEKQWNDNKARVQSELENILRIDITNNFYTIYIISDSLYAGRYIGNNKIIWGHKEMWPNYSTVYLTHEFLHSLLNADTVSHAIIELIADNELRCRLNNGGDYFYIGNQLIASKGLLEIEQTILPKWKEYLQNPKDNIFSFIAKAKTTFQ